MVGAAKRVTIYLGESDRWQGRPLYMALLETLRRQGLAGATVTRGLAGFGAHSRIHAATLADLSTDLPVVIEVVDTPERVTAALDIIGPMVSEGLITVEDVTVLKYTHRHLPTLPPGRRVRDVMATDVATAQPDTPLHAVVELLLRREVKAVPVVDDDRQVVGIITGGDLLTRGGLPVRLSLQRELPEEVSAHHLRVLEESGKTARDVMTPNPPTVRVEMPLGEAARGMAARGLKRQPVVDDAGRLVGMLSRIDILRLIAAAAQEAPPPGPPPLAWA